MIDQNNCNHIIGEVTKLPSIKICPKCGKHLLVKEV